MTKNAASLLVAVIFVVGCVHDLTEVAERTNEPAFLGALSGLYVLSIAIDDPVLPRCVYDNGLPRLYP